MKVGGKVFLFYLNKKKSSAKCFLFKAHRWWQLKEESEVIRQDRNMELSSRGRRESDGRMMERVWGRKGKTEKGNEWWVLKEQKEKRRWKYKKGGRQQAKSGPMNLAACRFMWCCGYHYTSTGGDSSNVMPLGLCVFIGVRIAPYFYSRSSHCSCLFQSKLSLIEHTHLWWGNIHPHPHCIFTKPICLAPLVERREV